MSGLIISFTFCSCYISLFMDCIIFGIRLQTNLKDLIGVSTPFNLDVQMLFLGQNLMSLR